MIVTTKEIAEMLEQLKTAGADQKDLICVVRDFELLSRHAVDLLGACGIEVEQIPGTPDDTVYIMSKDDLERMK